MFKKVLRAVTLRMGICSGYAGRASAGGTPGEFQEGVRSSQGEADLVGWSSVGTQINAKETKTKYTIGNHFTYEVR